jgi:hypothetical protein
MSPRRRPLLRFNDGGTGKQTWNGGLSEPGILCKGESEVRSSLPARSGQRRRATKPGPTRTTQHSLHKASVCQAFDGIEVRKAQ